jgi:16S rRNA processing protein RimM
LKSSNSASWICVGKILRAHSLKGELFLFLFTGSWDWYKPGLQVGLGQTQDSIPPLFLKIESLKPHKDGLILRLEGISDRNQSENLSKHFLFIEKSVLTAEVGELPYLYEFLGFEVFNKDQPIGHITNFSSNGAQDLLVVTNEKKTYEIPFVANFILDTCYQKKMIWMSLPNGLLDLNEKS